MAVAVSSHAGRLGRYYGRGVPFQEIMPQNAKEAFETVTGVKEERVEERMSLLMKEDEVKEILLKLHSGEDSSFFEDAEADHHTETTLKMIHSHVEPTAAKLKAKIQEFQEERRGISTREKKDEKND
jgi:hypothetical protein